MEGEVEKLKKDLEMKDKDCQLLKREVSGLHQDNDRINRMYQVVEKEAFTTGSRSKGQDRFESVQYEDYQKKGGDAYSKPVMGAGGRKENGRDSKWTVVNDDDFVPPPR